MVCDPSEMILAAQVDAAAAQVAADGDGGPAVAGVRVDDQIARGDVVSSWIFWAGSENWHRSASLSSRRAGAISTPTRTPSRSPPMPGTTRRATR